MEQLIQQVMLANPSLSLEQATALVKSLSDAKFTDEQIIAQAKAMITNNTPAPKTGGFATGVKKAWKASYNFVTVKHPTRFTWIAIVGAVVTGIAVENSYGVSGRAKNIVFKNQPPMDTKNRAKR